MTLPERRLQIQPKKAARRGRFEDLAEVIKSYLAGPHTHIEVRGAYGREIEALIGQTAFSEYKSRIDDFCTKQEPPLSFQWDSARFYANRAATNEGPLDSWNVVTFAPGLPDNGVCKVMPWRGIAPAD